MDEFLTGVTVALLFSGVVTVKRLFEQEGINTLDANGEVLLTILSSLAQQESESLSLNVKLGYQYRFQKGKVNVNYNRFLGYTKGEDGKLEIVPEEAEIVKRIYREYLEGGSTISIAKGLDRDGIRNQNWPSFSSRSFLGSRLEKIHPSLLRRSSSSETEKIRLRPKSRNGSVTKIGLLLCENPSKRQRIKCSPMMSSW